MKDAYYFSHDTNATQDPKMMKLLSRLGWSGVGIYWIIIEHLHQQPTGKMSESELDACLEFYFKFEKNTADLTSVKQVLTSVELLLTSDGYYFSDRVLRNKEMRSELSQKRSLAGKKSAELKRITNENSTSVQQVSTSVQQTVTKERKGKERKVKETLSYKTDFLTFWEQYPKKTGKDAAYKSWLIKSPPIERCLKTLGWQMKSDEWTKANGQYVPMPATWLNQGRWADIKPGHVESACVKCGYLGSLPKDFKGAVICSKCGYLDEPEGKTLTPASKVQPAQSLVPCCDNPDRNTSAPDPFDAEQEERMSPTIDEDGF